VVHCPCCASNWKKGNGEKSGRKKGNKIKAAGKKKQILAFCNRPIKWGKKT